MSIYKNLFVVIDPTSDKQPALDRAVNLARIGKSKVTAFSAVYKAVDEMIDANSRRSGKRDFLKDWESKVKNLLAPYKKGGVKISSDTYWTADWYAAVSRAAMRADADLVIKSTFRHGKLHRLLHSTSDFTIMRHSPSPVLLVREGKPINGKLILAALDLESTDEGHIGLNNSVMKHAHELADFTGLPLHVIAATSRKPDFSHVLAGVEEQEGGVQATLAHAFGVQTANFHLVKGAAQNVIPAQASELNADILVLGVSARSGIKGVMVGTTAKKVLDKLDCDVLAVN
ncbi:MAG: universal stress protein [Pseudohongiella sp.]|nr:universal stress protein [Pseudohongiella sp.]